MGAVTEVNAISDGGQHPSAWPPTPTTGGWSIGSSTAARTLEPGGRRPLGRGRCAGKGHRRDARSVPGLFAHAVGQGGALCRDGPSRRRAAHRGGRGGAAIGPRMTILQAAGAQGPRRGGGPLGPTTPLSAPPGARREQRCWWRAGSRSFHRKCGITSWDSWTPRRNTGWMRGGRGKQRGSGARVYKKLEVNVGGFCGRLRLTFSSSQSFCFCLSVG